MIGNDPKTQLAFAIYENRGVFALLLGSGLSRAAGIPTGWEITLDLIRRVAVAQGNDNEADWAQWYRAKTGQEPNYSALLEELASSPQERRSILHSYIEPTEDDRLEGRKLPTKAHGAIADLVRGGYIRVIVTTNFDRLLENALRERGVEPTVVASSDALLGAEPISHSACYVLKLHGDYKDARILNTDTELNAYPPGYDQLLDRVFDEYGLIVAGWSGEWDHALRAALLRAPNRRYPVFWATRSKPLSGAQMILDHRRARTITISDADTFFTDTLSQIETLAQTHRPNPISVDLLVGTAKRFLTKQEHRIQLDELVTRQAEQLLHHLDKPDFGSNVPWAKETFRTRSQKYESLVEPLARVSGVLGRWGDGSELPIILDILRSLYKHAEETRSGLLDYVNLRSYPAVLIFTAYGLGLTRSERWPELYGLFTGSIDRPHAEPVRVVDCLFLWAWSCADSKGWQPDDNRRLKTPVSDHLLKIFAEWTHSFVGLTPDYELLFERFELLGALAFLERDKRADIEAQVARNPPEWIWMPVGRWSWRESNRAKLISQLQSEPMRSSLTTAGFGYGHSAFMDTFVANVRHTPSRFAW